MKIAKTLLIALMSVMLVFAAVGCVDKDDGSSSSAGSDTPAPIQREIGVMFGGEEASDGAVVIDYRNALAGLTFYDKANADMDPISDELTALTLDNATVSSENYRYADGSLELTGEYIKSLELGKVYGAKAMFGEDSAEFTLKFTDEGAPAFKYLADDLLNAVYLAGAEISLPTASKSPASIQNISATYALTDVNGEEVSFEDEKFTASAGKYTWTATFYKNETVASVKSNEFVVINLDETNLAGEDVAVVFGGVYDETAYAAKYTGTCVLSQIEIPDDYKYVRVEYKGDGKVVCGDDETSLTADEYSVARIAVSDIASLKIISESGLYIRTFGISKVSAFNAEDVASLDFAKEDFFSLWNFNAEYGTPSYDNEADGVSFEGTGNSWPYTLQQGIIKTAYDNGYKYLVITYSGKGTTRIYNNTTGDWGGYSRDLAEATNRRLSYNLFEAAKKAELDETSGFSIITDSTSLVLTEFRFFKTDVVVEEEGIYNTANLVSKELTDKWSYNKSGSDAVYYNDEEAAMSFPANANYDTFNFEHDALRKAQKKGYTAVKFTVKGSKGEISLFVENNWGRDVKFSVNTNGEYAEGILYFGELSFNEKSGIAILSSDAKGGDPVLIKEMRFTNDLPVPEPDYTAMNLVSSELLEKWYYNADFGTPSYDETEQTMIFPANGNSETYTLSHGILKAAKAKGYNAIKLTAKGANASLRIFVSGSWSADAIYQIESENEYVTFTMHFAHLSLGDDSGITFLVSDAIGGRALYVKELKFDNLTVSEEVMNLMTGNLVSKENLGLWVSDGKGGTVSFDDENGYAKFDFTAISSIKLNLAFDEELLGYLKMFGKTKIVWNRDSSSVDYYGRVRLYADQAQFDDCANNKFSQEINILGAKEGSGRKLEMSLTSVTSTSIFAIHNKQVNTKNPECHIILTEVRFA